MPRPEPLRRFLRTRPRNVTLTRSPSVAPAAAKLKSMLGIALDAAAAAAAAGDAVSLPTPLVARTSSSEAARTSRSRAIVR